MIIHQFSAKVAIAGNKIENKKKKKKKKKKKTPDGDFNLLPARWP